MIREDWKPPVDIAGYRLRVRVRQVLHVGPGHAVGRVEPLEIEIKGPNGTKRYIVSPEHRQTVRPIRRAARP